MINKLNKRQHLPLCPWVLFHFKVFVIKAFKKSELHQKIPGFWPGIFFEARGGAVVSSNKKDTYVDFKKIIKKISFSKDGIIFAFKKLIFHKTLKRFSN